MLVVDFGAQYAHLIARRVREAGVYSEIVSPGGAVESARSGRPAGLILSGGPDSVYAPGAPRLDPALYGLGVPVLGICYGAQLMAQQLGGVVGRNTAGEYGRASLTVESGGGALLEGLPAEHPVWMSHADAVSAVPPGAAVTASTAGSPVAAFEIAERGLFGVQFHPEVAHSPHGGAVLDKFLGVCECDRDSWTPKSIIAASVAEISERVGPGRAICGLSGGVDSAVAAALARLAIGDRLTCVFVDTGLLREGEVGEVSDAFRRHFGGGLVTVDAADRFLGSLRGVSDPEAKRKAVGETFIRVFEQARDRAAAGEGPPAEFLVQGTLYPDVVESGTAHAATIKTHHNVGGVPGDADFEIVEPLRRLFKDETRAVGAALGLPDEIVRRQPFPGPGLAVRVVGEVTAAKLETLRHADAVVAEELRGAGLLDEIWQSFAVLAGVSTVGVMGDERTYGQTVAVRAVTGADAMTADWARIPHSVLETISQRLINEVDGVNRVVYDITSKPPGTIEWE